MGKRAFLFPGQGAQFVGMGKDLADISAAAKVIFERANERLGIDIQRMCFEGPEEDLTRTDIQQPAILTHSIAAVEALREKRGDEALVADATAGLSLGEYSALIFAEALTFEDGVHLVRKRGEFMQAACEEHPSGLAAVMKLDRATVQGICKEAAKESGEYCGLGNIIAEGNITISGGKQAIDIAVEKVKAQKGRGLVLPVAGAFHSPYMQSAEDKLKAEIEATPMQAPRIPVLSNVTAEPVTDVETLRTNLVGQLTGSVLWADSMTRLLNDGFDRFWEVGPGKALTGSLRRVAKSAELMNIAGAGDLET